MGAAVLVSDPVEVGSAHQQQRLVVRFDEVVGVGLHIEADPVLLEVGGQFLDGAVPLGLALPGSVAVTGELGGDLAHVQLVGEFEEPAPVAHLRLPFRLVGARPVEDGVQGADAHPRLLLGLVELGHVGVVGLGVVVPEVEVRARGHLHVSEAEFRRLVQDAGGRVGRVVHIGVEGDVNHGAAVSLVGMGWGRGGGRAGGRPPRGGQSA